ncbi:hypothetical protein [Kocuria sp. CPCC 205263]|uniref:hypothetical protein n=1 Tax=Kocuria sp. CPCC 205263 TaxID=3073555 RepID=UPI0034D79BFD
MTGVGSAAPRSALDLAAGLLLLSALHDAADVDGGKGEKDLLHEIPHWWQKWDRAAGYLLSTITVVIIPVPIAGLLAGLLFPMVKRLRTQHVPAGVATGLVVSGMLDARFPACDSERMDISKIGRYVGQQVRIRSGGTNQTGTVDHVQSVTYTVGAGGGARAGKITDGYVVVLDGTRLEFSPGDEFEILDGT